MKIPKQVKVGGIVYKVIVAFDWYERNGADGETFYHTKQGNVIYIGQELSQQAKEITLLHEMLHCMNATVNHEFLDSLAEQLYQALSDNRMLR